MSSPAPAPATSGPGPGPGLLQWKLSQVLGEPLQGEKLEEVDTISAMEFDSSGNNLAVGDYGGRIILFERADRDHFASRNELESWDYTAAAHPTYTYKAEFQSHELEFDYLNSLEIGEKINKLRWCAQPNSSLFILSTNDRTIKLWKVSENKLKKVKESKPSLHIPSENALLAEKSFLVGEEERAARNGYYLEWRNKKPRNTPPTSEEGPEKVVDIGDTTTAKCRRIYSHAHDFSINSISNNSDGETFISADDLRINLWNLEISNQCFNIIDMRPFDMEDLVEVITSAEFHPSYCNLLAYSSSRGFIRLVDLRQSAVCDQNVRICGTCTWKVLLLQLLIYTNTFAPSCRSCIIPIPSSTSLGVALARMGATLPVDLTAIISEFSLVTVDLMMGLLCKLAETQTGHHTQIFPQKLQGCLQVLLSDSIEEDTKIRALIIMKRSPAT